MKLSEVAQIMYDLQEYCKWINGGNDYNPYNLKCKNCPFHSLRCSIEIDKYQTIPLYWDITPADIERLRNKEIEPWTCKDCRHYQCRVSVFSTSQVCEKFELWQ